MRFFGSLVFPGGFMPHGYCYLWTPGLIELHAASDSLIALSYIFRETVGALATVWLQLNRAPARRDPPGFPEKRL